MKGASWPLGATLPRRHSVIPSINYQKKSTRSSGKRSSSVADMMSPTGPDLYKKPASWIDHHGPKDLVVGKGFVKTEWAARSKEEIEAIKQNQKAGMDTVQSIL